MTFFSFFTAVMLPLSFASDVCSNIHFCKVDMRTWGQKGWKLDYTKTIELKNLCLSNKTPQELPLDPTIQISFSIAPGDPKAADKLLQGPGFLAHIYAAKNKSVIANHVSEVNDENVRFHSRIGAGQMMEVTCGKTAPAPTTK